MWTSAKVAAFIARELGLTSVAVQRGWEALKACGMSIQTPRPKNPKSATPEETAAFKKTSRTSSPRKRKSIPSSRSRSSPATNTGSA
ncbi:winged helix-turn-helix domain-containing protein [Methylocystis sp.]|uniref:helix-turn-helix domain-containing protein n=1 Tax=Methylocystis sp. TaxID=1911079 RepID=UPI0025EF6D6F|nr:winged helix-turn-helix domain-containing protein [Methylocystis sp.]